MITIHATKKLHAKLPLNPEGLLAGKQLSEPSPLATINNPLSGWHANLITLQRRNCVLLVHDVTRFPLFIKSLAKADFTNLQWHFEDALMNTLLKLGANQNQLDAAASLLEPCQFNTECNRSVQGTMNQMKGDIEHMLWYDQANLEDISSYKTSVWLADRPCTVKGMKDCVWPHKAMLALLAQDQPQQSKQQGTNNVIKLADYRGQMDD
jgi:hypothetical protein